MTESIRLEPGQTAPAFTLPNQNDKNISLRDLNGMWVVVYFYPKDDTPGCTTEACDFSSGLKGFEKLNARVLGISPDSTESHRNFIARHKLKVTLISDPDRKALTKYGAWGTKKLYGKEHVGVIRSTFIVDPKGKIGHAWYGVKATGHAEKVAAKLKELAG